MRTVIATLLIVATIIGLTAFYLFALKELILGF